MTHQPLPTSRALLTSLLNAIANIPLLASPLNHDHDSDKNQIRRLKSLVSDDSSLQNPLRRVPASHRHLLATLHVLFPGLVLPALDLLERGLVAKVGLSSGTVEGGDGGGEGGGGNSDGIGNGDRVRRDDRSERGSPFFYLVTSSSSAAASSLEHHSAERRHGRRGRQASGFGEDDGAAGTGKRGREYIVRLEAWSCTCAAFAFAAVQGEEDTGAEWEWDDGLHPEAETAEETEGEKSWSFGGLSRDGVAGGEGVPVCKHLLACVLAERWSSALGRFVVERMVTREEMAGIVADV